MLVLKGFVYASSAATYGSLPELPKREDQPRNYPSPYALSKGVDEDYANLWASDETGKLGKGMTCIGLRYFNVYGPLSGSHFSLFRCYLDLCRQD